MEKDIRKNVANNENVKINYVFQYDLEGNKLAEYESIADASRILGISDSHIADVMHGIRKSCGGFVFKLNDSVDSYQNKIVNTAKGIMQCDNNGNVIKTFVSISSASKETGITRSTISECVNGMRNSAGGYIWKKSNDSEKEENPLEGTPILQLDRDDNVINEWPSIAVASKCLGFNVGSLRASLVGGYLYNGFKWKYKENTIHSNKGTSIRQLDMSGNLIKQYNSVASAAKETGFLITSIRRCLRGDRKSLNGYKWEYTEEK